MYFCLNQSANIFILKSSVFVIIFATLTQFPYQKIKKKSLILCFFPHSALKTVQLPSPTTPGISLPKAVRPSMLTETVPVGLMSSVVAPEKPTSNTMGPKEVSTYLTPL